MREVAPCLMAQMWNKGQLGSGGWEEILVPDAKPGFFVFLCTVFPMTPNGPPLSHPNDFS